MNPAVRQIILTSANQWRNTLPALRAFVTANYDQPNPHNTAAMASPPTITVSSGGTPPTGVTTAYLYISGSTIQRYAGGADKTYTSVYRRFPSATIASTGGNVDDGKQATAWRVTTVTNAAKVAFRVLGGASRGYRFIVNGEYASTTATSVPTGGGNYVLLDFGSSVSRTVSIEGKLDHGFQGIYTAPGDAIAAPSAFKRVLVIGDSFCEATGVTERADGLGMVAADVLGFQDCWQSGAGGTGYIANSSNTKFNLSQRLQDATTTGPWDAIVVAMGINDIGQSAALIAGETGYCLRSIRRANPAAQIFVLGPWDVNAPAAPVANYAATKAAIVAGIPVNVGATFLDPEGVTFTKSDAAHPDTAGHQTLGEWLALEIKTALGA
jgi:lysophospholipase L1-like esterase